MMRLDIAGQSDPGRQREQNEDCFDYSLAADDPSAGLIVVADGMGGYAAGEVASATAVQRILRVFGDLREGPLADRLRQAVEAGNLDVYRASQEPGRRGMGSTVVCVAVEDCRLVSAHVGDSRLYRLRGAALQRLTRDHSLVQARVDSGLMTLEEAEAAGNRNVITRALGLQPEVDVELGEHELEAGDRFLLCTDGLCGQVKDQEILDLIAFARPDEACRRLIDLANQRGGPDNITAVIVAIAGSDAALDDRTDSHPTQELAVPTAPTREITALATAAQGRADASADGETATVPIPPGSTAAAASAGPGSGGADPAGAGAGSIPAEPELSPAQPIRATPPVAAEAPRRDSGPLTTLFTVPPSPAPVPESPPLRSPRAQRRPLRAALIGAVALAALVVVGMGYRSARGAPTSPRTSPSAAATTVSVVTSSRSAILLSTQAPTSPVATPVGTPPVTTSGIVGPAPTATSAP